MQQNDSHDFKVIAKMLYRTLGGNPGFGLPDLKMARPVSAS